jgi:hypothetical protein
MCWRTPVCAGSVARISKRWQPNARALRKMAQCAGAGWFLATKLSVMASHERERQLARVSVRERVRRLAANINLAFDNLMRPVALPLTGGLLSALLVFGLMMPSLSFRSSDRRRRFLHLAPGQHRYQSV